jgi:hypothetical protein
LNQPKVVSKETNNKKSEGKNVFGRKRHWRILRQQRET